VSQGIGTGGRDLKNERVGGMTMLTGIEALAGDPDTKVIVVISKPPAPDVAEKVRAALRAAGKPAVVSFIGLAGSDPAKPILSAGNLEEAARMAAALAKDEAYSPRMFDLGEDEIERIVERETSGMSREQKWLRGYYTGGTLADEAWLLLHESTGAVYSNNQTDPAFILPDPRTSIGHTVVDLGDDVFTVGRPHPMIDPSTRNERIAAERNDASVAVMLADVVLGYGSHPDPAGALAPEIAASKAAAAARGGCLSAVVSVTGTPGDFQGFEAQKAKLEAAGAVVMPSNHQAALLAVNIVGRLGRRQGGRE
jgi:hypothetical protein